MSFTPLAPLWLQLDHPGFVFLLRLISTITHLYPSQMILPVTPVCKILTIRHLRYARLGVMMRPYHAGCMPVVYLRYARPGVMMPIGYMLRAIGKSHTPGAHTSPTDSSPGTSTSEILRGIIGYFDWVWKCFFGYFSGCKIIPTPRESPTTPACKALAITHLRYIPS